MRVRNKLAVVMAVAALTAGIAVTAATAPSAAAATTACGWEAAPIATAGDASSGIIELEYNTCDRSVRAHGYDLQDDYGSAGIGMGSHGTVTKLRVYNEDTMQEAASGVLYSDTPTFTTGAIDDAGTASRACLQNGTDNDNVINWYGSICTVYF